LKLPHSQLSNSELEALFQGSTLMEKHFFRKDVPKCPIFESDLKKIMFSDSKPLEDQKHENQLEKN